MEPDFQQNASFYDELAAQYDSRLASNPRDALARRAFQELAMRYVPSGSTLLDLGCGTGLDALEYARHGYRVLAYDNSPGMVAQLQRRCGAEITSGRVTPYSMPYPSFLDSLAFWPKPDAVTANFAVLNSIRDLRPLFERVGGHMAPSGCFVVSILNPLHWSMVKTRNWWRGALQAPRGPRSHTTHPYVSYLHFVSEILRAARGFRLVGRAHAGQAARYHAIAPVGAESLYWPGPAPQSMKSRLWRSPLYRLFGHFLFLVLRRDP